MSDNKSEPKAVIKKSTLVIMIVVFVVLIFAAVLFTKFICDKINSNLERVNKWGMVVDIAKDPNCADYHTSVKETDSTLTLSAGGTYGVFKLDESQSIYYADFSGALEKPVKLDCTGKITFPDDSFMVNGQFECPVEFYLGTDELKNPIIVKGIDYIGKKDQLEAAIAAGFDKSDRSYIPAFTNVSEYSLLEENTYKWTMPQENAKYFGSKGKIFKVEIELKLSEINSK